MRSGSSNINGKSIYYVLYLFNLLIFQKSDKLFDTFYYNYTLFINTL